MLRLRPLSWRRPSRAAGTSAVGPPRSSACRRAWAVTAAWPQTSGDFSEEGHNTEVRDARRFSGVLQGHNKLFFYTIWCFLYWISVIQAENWSQAENGLKCPICAPHRSWCGGGGRALRARGGGVQLCLQAGGEQAGASRAGLGLHPQCLPPGLLRGPTPVVDSVCFH